MGATRFPENVVSPWIDANTAVGMTNSWVNYGAGFAFASYLKDVNGLVMVRGTVRSGASGTSCFTLPTECRPLQPIFFIGVSGGIACSIYVNTDGTITITGTSVGTFACLDNLHWFTT